MQSEMIYISTWIEGDCRDESDNAQWAQKWKIEKSEQANRPEWDWCVGNKAVNALGQDNAGRTAASPKSQPGALRWVRTMVESRNRIASEGAQKNKPTKQKTQSGCQIARAVLKKNCFLRAAREIMQGERFPLREPQARRTIAGWIYWFSFLKLKTVAKRNNPIKKTMDKRT